MKAPSWSANACMRFLRTCRPWGSAVLLCRGPEPRPKTGVESSMAPRSRIHDEIGPIQYEVLRARICSHPAVGRRGPKAHGEPTRGEDGQKMWPLLPLTYLGHIFRRRFSAHLKLKGSSSHSKRWPSPSSRSHTPAPALALCSCTLGTPRRLKMRSSLLSLATAACGLAHVALADVAVATGCGAVASATSAAPVTAVVGTFNIPSTTPGAQLGPSLCSPPSCDPARRLLTTCREGGLQTSSSRSTTTREDARRRSWSAPT